MKFTKFGLVFALLVAMGSEASWGIQEVQSETRQEAEGGEVESGDVQEEEQVEEMAVPMAAFGQDQQLEAQKASVKAELKLIQGEFELDDEWLSSIEKTVEDEIKAAAERLAEDQMDQVVFTSAPSPLDLKLQSQLWENVRKSLPEGTSAKFEDFKKRRKALRAYKDDVGIDGVLYSLDSNLCLSIEQIGKLKEKYLESWDSRHNDLASMSAMNGMLDGGQIFELIGKEAIKEILNDKQFEVFENLENSSNLMMELEMAQIGNGDGIDEEKVKSKCNAALDLKVDEYRRLVGLTAKQEKLLGVGRKGAVGSVTKSWLDLAAKFREDPNAMMTDRELLATMMEPISKQCISKSAWTKVLGKAFDEEQLETIRERENARDSFALDQILRYVVIAMTSQQVQLNLTLEQHKALVKGYRKHISPDKGTFAAVWFGIVEAPDDMYKSVLNEEQWSQLEPILKMQKESMEAMKEASENSGEVDADEDTKDAGGNE